MWWAHVPDGPPRGNAAGARGSMALLKPLNRNSRMATVGVRLVIHAARRSGLRQDGNPRRSTFAPYRPEEPWVARPQESKPQVPVT